MHFGKEGTTVRKQKHQGQVIGTGEKIFNIFMVILGILISLVVLYPIYYALIASLSKPLYVENGTVMFSIKNFTLESYRQAVAKPGIWRAYGNKMCIRDRSKCLRHKNLLS